MRPTNEELKRMFGEVPDSFASAMDKAINAAIVPDEKELRPVKKLTYRAPLLAALMLAAMMAVGVHVGVLDYLSGLVIDVQVPDASQQQMLGLDTLPETLTLALFEDGETEVCAVMKAEAPTSR